jgi:hypothetical protein
MFHGLIISPGLFVSAVQGDYVMSHLLLLFQALGTDIMWWVACQCYSKLCEEPLHTELLVIIILNILKDHLIQ